MKREIVEPTRDADGDEEHPAWGLIGASRISGGDGILFDSDITHQHHVRIRLQRCVRKRDLNQDWIHGRGPEILEVALSEAQWASFVSSMNTTGVPCTITRTEEGPMPAFPYEPRLQESVQEVGKAGAKALADITRAQRAVDEAFERGAGKKEMRSLLHHLRCMVENGPKNMEFAADSLTEHAENVVQKARVDIEAMVTNQARALGIESDMVQPLQLAAPPKTRTRPGRKNDKE